MSPRISISDPIEELYGSSGAVSAGDRLFVSGVAGDGATTLVQFSDITDRIRDSLGQLDAAPEDIVRTRVFYTDPSDHEELGRAHGEAFGSARPAMSLTQVHHLPGDARVVVEAEAMRNSASAREAKSFDMPNAAEWGYAGAVRVGHDIWVAGVTARQPGGSILYSGDLAEQSRWAADKIVGMIESMGGRVTDIVSTRHYTAVAYVGASTTPERLRLMHPHHPTSAGITVQGVGERRLGELIEVEAVVGAGESRGSLDTGRPYAVVGAGASRSNLNTGRPYEEDHHYCRSVRVGDVVYVAGTTSVQLDEEVGSPFGAYSQTLQTLDWIRWGIEEQGLSFRDTVRTRSYVVGEENIEPFARGLKEALGGIRPAATVVGVPALGRPSILVEIEATAVRGAGSG